MAGSTRSRYEHPWVVFRKSTIHGWGGFARQNLRGGKRIIEYVGPKVTKVEAGAALERQNCYIFTVNDEFDLDGSVDWNPARLINHSCAPNCETNIVRNRVWIYALKTIKQGEELTYNYGHDLEGFEDRPCHCGSLNCVGYIVAEEHFAQVTGISRRRRNGGLASR